MTTDTQQPDKPMSTRSILCEVTGAQNLERLRTAIFNCWGVKVYGISVDSRDTVFRYQVQTDERLIGATAKNLPMWIKGFIQCLKSIS